MRLNWLGYIFDDAIGYGKYSNRMIAALRKAGVTVRPELAPATRHPQWLLDERGMTWDCPTISCMPPYHLLKLPKVATGQHWLLTMTEGGELPTADISPEGVKLSDGWAETINKANISRVIVPCEHNAQVFRAGGVDCPVSVIPGGTDPDEFPLWTAPRPVRPYTFLTLADRGKRKGWNEVYDAFWRAFGTVRETGPDAVRLIVKCRPEGNDIIEETVKRGVDLDPRITYLVSDEENLRDLFTQVDCLALPSRTEGWGMPHREAAMMGLPVITQAWSGLDDGHTRAWAMVLEKGKLREIDDKGKHIKGEWMVADIDELASRMAFCKNYPKGARDIGGYGAKWLRANQTWDIAALRLIGLMQQECVLEPERMYA